MGRLPSLLVVSVLLALASGQAPAADMEVSVPKGEPVKTPDGPFTVMPTPAPSSTTVKPTEPTKPTKPTTPATTTIAPTVPTKPTTPTTPTTKPTTPTTTVAPTTPPPTKPTPPPPTPAPPKPPANIDPPTGDWNISYVAPINGSCIFAKMAIQFEVPYHTKHNETWHAYVDIPKDANATGNCDNLSEKLKLSWGNNSVVFDFTTKVNGTWYLVDQINLSLYKDEKNFPDMDNSSQTINLMYGKSLFNTTEKMSYKCAKIQTFNLTMDNSNATMGYMHIGHLQLQAFAAKNSKGFADAVDCEPAGTPDIVPIAAGCALAALIIIVLGAYLIGRKRSQARGYLSM